jgi:hypothetical protein
MARLGYVVVVDDTEDGCHERLRQAAARLRIRMAGERTVGAGQA